MTEVTRFSDLLRADIESVKLETDASGFVRVLFAGDEKKRVDAYLTEELNNTHEDWQPLWNEAVENLETYRATRLSTPPIPDSGQVIYPAPLARIPANQIIASTYNTIMRARPIFKWDAYLGASYEMPRASAMPPMMDGAPPMPPSTPQVESQSAEEVAKRLRQGYEFVVRERIGFGRKLQRAIGSAVKGCPVWWKVVADPQERSILTPKVNGIAIDLDDKYELTRMRGDIVQHYLIPFFNGMMPLEYLYLEDAFNLTPWFGERDPWRPDDLLKRFEAGELFLIESDEEAQQLAKSVSDHYDPNHARAAATTERKSLQKPIQDCDVWRTWFYRNVKYVDPVDGKKKVKRLNLIGAFHRTGGKLMDCYLNNYEHQERPFELIDEMDDGGSTVANMKYHQTVFTHLGQSDIKNAFHANIMLYWYDPDNSVVETFFKANPVIQPGTHIPGKEGEDWGVVRGGSEHFSMLEHMKFFLSMSQLDSKQNKYSQGDPGGRTPANTMAQAIEQSSQEPHLFLHRLSAKFSRLLRLDAETRRQYQPLGEILPMWDEHAKATLELPFRFPVGDCMDNFRVALTASDEALAKEQDPQQIMALKKALMDDGEYVAKVIAAIINTQTPLSPATLKIFQKIINRDQKTLRQLVGEIVTDEDAYDLTKEIEDLVGERNAQLDQQRQMQMEQAYAQMQAAGRGATVPAGPAPGAAGAPGPTGVQPTVPQQPPVTPQAGDEAAAGGVVQ